jgi:hypothetical protein
MDRFDITNVSETGMNVLIITNVPEIIRNVSGWPTGVDNYRQQWIPGSTLFCLTGVHA